jgi:transposase InsO family protein
MEAVQEAVTNYGVPTIFNTDQGCQFTSLGFTGILKAHGIQISMDGTGCWRDNVFVERLWKSIKYERGLSARLRDRQCSPPGIGPLPEVLQPDKAAPSA